MQPVARDFDFDCDTVENSRPSDASPVTAPTLASALVNERVEAEMKIRFPGWVIGSGGPDGFHNGQKLLVPVEWTTY